MEHGQGNPVLAAFFDLKNRSHDLINRLLPSPGSAVLNAILLGERHEIPPDLSDAFNLTGTSHVITISGSNIAIVVGLLMFILGRLLNKRAAALLTVIGIGLYVVFVGAGASVVRAAIISTLAIVAQRLGRRGNGLTALAATIFIMTAINPFVLFDLALILGSAATLGLLLYSRPLTELAERGIARISTAQTARRIIPILSDTLLITIAAQLTTLPIIALVWGIFSPSSFLVNMLIGPAQGLIMLLGILMLALGAIALPLGQIAAWLVSLPLTYTLSVIRNAAQWPGAADPVTPSLGAVVVYYAILIAATIYLSRPAETRQNINIRLRKVAIAPILSVLGIGVAGLLWAMVISRPDGKLHVWFLAVGQGNAVLIQTPNGADFLIDGGDNPTQLQSAVGDRLPFYKHDLDAVFITEPKRNTMAALPRIFERYHIKTVLSTGQFLDDETSRVVNAAIVQAGTQLTSVSAGYSLQTNDGVRIEVVNPAEKPQPTDKPEDNSLILRLTYGDASFLLTSNLSEKGIKKVLDSKLSYQSIVLELFANGGDKPNSQDWLKAISPQIAVIRAELGSRTAQPADTVLQLLKDIPIYRTDAQGTIEIATDGAQLFVSTARQN